MPSWLPKIVHSASVHVYSVTCHDFNLDVRSGEESFDCLLAPRDPVIVNVLPPPVDLVELHQRSLKVSRGVERRPEGLSGSHWVQGNINVNSIANKYFLSMKNDLQKIQIENVIKTESLTNWMRYCKLTRGRLPLNSEQRVLYCFFVSSEVMVAPGVICRLEYHHGHTNHELEVNVLPYLLLAM